MDSEFGFNAEQRAAADAAEKSTPARLRVILPRRRPATVRRARTNRQGDTVIVTEPAPDPVPDAISAALSNELLGGVPIEAPAQLDDDETARFWAGVREHRAKVGGRRG